MSSRFVVVLASAAPAQAPPGTDAGRYRRALLEDVYEVAAGLELVTAALAAPAAVLAEAESITWPGTPVLEAGSPLETLIALAALGATEAVILAPDAPDLPALLIGKLFRALGSAPASVCPDASGEGLVALAARFPLPAWLTAVLAEVTLDTPDALTRLRAAASFPGQVQKAPAWHRLRTRADVSLLDPGLEGWDNTRALLS
ncbi:MAG: hypothetical protein ABIS86_17340 [Streptosporangiaceae bacterium]